SRSRVGSISSGGFFPGPRVERMKPLPPAPCDAANPRCEELMICSHPTKRGIRAGAGHLLCPVMNDDWRVRIDVHDDSVARALTEQLNADELEHDLDHAFHDRVVLSVEGSLLFAYAGSREQAQRVAGLGTQLAPGPHVTLDVQIAHWHPVSEEWESPDAPMPVTAADAEE